MEVWRLRSRLALAIAAPPAAALLALLATACQGGDEAGLTLLLALAMLGSSDERRYWR
jgi:hypothetical protein